MPPTSDAKLAEATVVAIKIVALSTIAARFEPKVLFQALDELITTIGDSARGLGGHVDPGYRSEFLAFFAQAAEGGNANDNAFMFANQLQEANAARLIECGTNSLPTLALRIGIDSGVICLGTLQAARRPIRGYFGAAIETARLLAEMCDPHALLISDATSDGFKEIDANASNFKTRMLDLPDSSAPRAMLYFDTLEFEPDIRHRASQLLSACAGSIRQEQRWRLTLPDSLVVMTKFGAAMAYDVSRSGIGLLLTDELAIGTKLGLTVSPRDERLQGRLQRRKLSELVGVVRTVKKVSDRFLIGLSFENLSEEQKDRFLAIIFESQRSSSDRDREPVA